MNSGVMPGPRSITSTTTCRPSRRTSTSKRQGSGIGAWQARELLREAGSELSVLSRPGAGTTMRVLLRDGGEAAPRAEDTRPVSVAAQPVQGAA
jgi:hypothetical protein